ncbi:MAG: LysR family transcriptional regulator [Eubacteriales bacterium]|nr:LysR family transcriptional regulator [Eubacteriales bacterium]
MSISKYKAFLKVAELGSLTKAADALGYSQPNISHMIKTLEDEFGFALFFRRKDKCTLTKNAESILYYCMQIVKNDEELHANIRGIHGMLTGSIRIGATNSTMIDFVPKAIYCFASQYTGIELLPSEMEAEAIINDLRLGKIDIGFLDEDSVPGELKSNFIPLFKDPICLLIPQGHPLAGYERVPMEMLGAYDFILPTIPSSNETSAYADLLSGIDLNVKYKSASDLAIFGMVENNLGISITSKELSKYLRCKVESREFEDAIFRTQGALIISLNHATPAVKEFINISKTVEIE